MNFDEFLGHFDNVKRTGPDTAVCSCPCKGNHKHGDKNPSLSIKLKNDGKILVCCHTGCSTSEILSAVGLKMSDLYNNSDQAWIKYVEGRTHEHFVTSYDYTDLDGHYLHTKVRLVDDEGEKHFEIGILDPVKHMFHFGSNDHGKPCIFGSVSKVRKAIADGETVYITEGEKDALTMADKGFTAVTYGSASSWNPDDAELFKNAKVIVLIDNDSDGRKVAREIRESLDGVAESTKFILPDPDDAGGDITDFCKNHSDDELKQVLEGPEAVLDDPDDAGDPAPEDAAEKSKLHLTSLNDVEEKEAEYLEPDRMPKNQITTIVGEGGVGKTFLECAIAAAQSTGKLSFMNNNIPPDWCDYGPQKVLIFSAEDSLAYTLRRRLRKNGADLENIFSIDISDEQFKDVKFNNNFLEELISEVRPALVIFDPIQAFVQSDIHMGERNAMRSNLEPLIGYGEKYGTTFLIIVHANKQANVWGRKRMADSADIWDISRSVLMAGATEEQGIFYLSHEKNNYGPTAQTVLYSIEDEVVTFKGYTDKKDRDFVMDRQYESHPSPAKDEATDFILEYLADGEKAVSDLDDSAKAIGISGRTLKRAKSDLKKDQQIAYRNEGQGKDKKYFVYLL